MIFRDFDFAVIEWLNGFVGRSMVIDKVVVTTLGIELIKDVPLVAGLWWVWFSKSSRISAACSRLLAFGGLLGVVAACVVSRGVQDLLPARPRPLYEPALNLTIPAGLPPGVMADYSSFPSDTSSLAFALSTVIWLRSRPLGALAYFWSFLVVCLPRVYVGFHYPIDIIGGAILGTSLVLVIARSAVSSWLYERFIAPVEASHAGLFYSLAFLVTYQVGSVFEDARRLGSAFATFLKMS
jgi:undecaprenyl-diphosphatase